jgi:uncharacterized integral membrane protein (TIGR00697 family)
MNECLFAFHSILTILCCRGALFLGKEALQCWVILQPILANLFVLKQITLFGFDATSSDLYVVGSVLGLNYLQEFFGKESARLASKLSLYTLGFFVIASSVHLLYTPSAHDTAHTSYAALFSYVPRLVFASFATFWIVQRFDIFFFGLLQKTGLKLFFRNLLSLFVSQFLDTLLFTFLGLWNVVASLFDVFFVSFLIKALSIVTLILLSPRKYHHETISL